MKIKNAQLINALFITVCAACLIAVIVFVLSDARTYIRPPEIISTAEEIEEETIYPDDLRININTADFEEFCDIGGISEQIAQSIIDYRAQHGDFQSVSELMEVKGIGKKFYDDNYIFFRVK